MEDDDSEATQATQTALDPRRVGGQNSGFSDEEISDIICVLYPTSDAARAEVRRLANEGSPHIIDNDEADGVESDDDNPLGLGDHPSRFEPKLLGAGPNNYAILLRLSAQVKNPVVGFAFGRNLFKCDLVFVNDPVKRVSNIHFRIYVNEWGSVMIEDQSTNGTMVDENILTKHARRPTTATSTATAGAEAHPNHHHHHTKRTLSSGSIIGIQLHSREFDLVFRVRIPRRDDEFERTYMKKVREYFASHRLPNAIEAGGRGAGGHVNLFRRVTQPGQGGHGQGQQRPSDTTTVAAAEPSAGARAPTSPKRRDSSGYQAVTRKEWTGSGKYNKVGMIGKGAFAVVYKVTSKYDGHPYAAKELEKRRFIKDGVLDAKAENEMRIMKKIQHPNIVQYMEHFELDDRLLVIIMEFVPGGDLGRLIADEGPLSEPAARAMSQQLLSALGYLHRNNITHRDIKPDNILINNKTDPLEFKLTDFGLSKMIDTEQTFLQTFCGTLLYCAPEVYTEYDEYDDNGVRSRGRKTAAARRGPGQRYSHAVDVWSLGGVLFFTLTRGPPFPVRSGISYSELLHQIMTTALNIQPLQRHGVSDRGIDFLLRMLHRRPEYRATVDELVDHPWLSHSPLMTTIEASQSSHDDGGHSQRVAVVTARLASRGQRGRANQNNLEDSDDDEIVSDSAGELEDGRMDESLSDAERGSDTRTTRLFGEISGQTSRTPDRSQSDASQVYRSAETIRRCESDAQPRASSSQSLDQLQSLVEDVASQSLGDSVEGAAIDAESFYSTPSVEPSTSKRRPQSPLDHSDEFDSATHEEKPIIKRLKSDTTSISQEMIEEYQLLARLPQVKRSASGRQIDQPVKKPIYWEKDLRTWHLNYPEMTQLQQDAFVQAARDAGEEFAPGKTALWAIAMKYFPSTCSPERQRHSYHQPDSHNVNVEPLGMLVPDAESGISPSIPIRDTLISFGRAQDKSAFAFKILLWKDGYDPSEDPVKVPPPWLRQQQPPDADSFFCWISISTKASTNGMIMLNNHTLHAVSSRDRDREKGQGQPVPQWTKIYDGDHLTIWPREEVPAATKPPRRLLFRCFWGGSSGPRPARVTGTGSGSGSGGLELASERTAQQLAVACRETEGRMRSVGEKMAAAERGRRRVEAEAEYAERVRNVERERDRSRVFEEKRGEAVRYLALRRSAGKIGGYRWGSH